jgi:hypothetical protein
VSRLTWVPHSATARFRVRDYHPLWSAFPGGSANKPWSYRGPATPMPLSRHRFRLFFPGSLATTTGITRCFLFLRVLRCFTSPGSLYRIYEFIRCNWPLRQLGFPIRTSADQCSVGNSPQLFAATHVLHRLSAPRHPPHALSSLLTSLSLTSSPIFRRCSMCLELEAQAPALRSSPRSNASLLF